jgi:hypothetical protein
MVALGNGAAFSQPPPMWCDTSQQFQNPARHVVGAREPRHPNGNKHLMSAQPNSAHYNNKEPLLSMPQSKPHSVQI